jgi:hypothetical protein
MTSIASFEWPGATELDLRRSVLGRHCSSLMTTAPAGKAAGGRTSAIRARSVAREQASPRRRLRCRADRWLIAAPRPHACGSSPSDDGEVRSHSATPVGRSVARSQTHDRSAPDDCHLARREERPSARAKIPQGGWADSPALTWIEVEEAGQLLVRDGVQSARDTRR